jgi:hypothetical protein
MKDRNAQPPGTVPNACEDRPTQTRVVTQKTCEFCPRSVDCSNLYTALKLLDQQSQLIDDPVQLGKIENFKRRLAHLKFDYPVGQQSCLLARDEKLARELVDESILLLTGVQKKESAS